MRTPPEYETPEGATCKECGLLCEVTPLLNEFDYEATHCGSSGTHYPGDWGKAVSDCCEGEYEIVEEEV